MAVHGQLARGFLCCGRRIDACRPARTERDFVELPACADAENRRARLHGGGDTGCPRAANRRAGGLRAHRRAVRVHRPAAGMRLVFVQSDGEAHQERVCEEIDAPAEQLALRMVLQPTGDDTARAAFAYQHQGDWRRFGEPFSPARHTWVGARMALFAMSLDGENHGGAGKFGPFRVTKA